MMARYLLKKDKALVIIVVTVTGLLLFFSLSSSKPRMIVSRPKYGILTFFSQNHVCEAIHSCQTYANITEIKSGNIVFIGIYAEDVSEEHLAIYHKACPFVELRPFAVSKYPEYFKNLKNFRFKIPTAVEVLQEFRSIMYIDTSIRFVSMDNETILDLFHSMETDFAPQGIRLFSNSTHANYPVTHPQMYEFFNVTEEQMKETFQLQAGLFMLNNSPAGKNIANKLIQCSMEPKCMAPEGAQSFCHPQLLRSNNQVICHRFDQSAVNMRLIELYGLNQSVYYRPSSLFEVVREWGFWIIVCLPLYHITFAWTAIDYTLIIMVYNIGVVWYQCDSLVSKFQRREIFYLKLDETNNAPYCQSALEVLVVLYKSASIVMAVIIVQFAFKALRIELKDKDHFDSIQQCAADECYSLYCMSMASYFWTAAESVIIISENVYKKIGYHKDSELPSNSDSLLLGV